MKLFLTKRQKEVLIIVGRGYSNKEVADQLGVRPESVKKHLRNIYEKFQVNNRVQAFRSATRLGLIPFEPFGSRPEARMNASLLAIDSVVDEERTI